MPFTGIDSTLQFPLLTGDQKAILQKSFFVRGTCPRDKVDNEIFRSRQHHSCESVLFAHHKRSQLDRGHALSFCFLKGSLLRVQHDAFSIADESWENLRANASFWSFSLVNTGTTALTHFCRAKSG